jgi:hypothetical protein
MPTLRLVTGVASRRNLRQRRQEGSNVELTAPLTVMVDPQ